MISLFSPQAFPHKFSAKILNRLGKGCQWLVDRLGGIRQSHAQPAQPAAHSHQGTRIANHFKAASGNDCMADTPVLSGYDEEQRKRIEDFTRQCAARKLQQHFRKFMECVTQKPFNEFGSKIMENYHSVGNEGETRRRYNFDADNHRFATEKGDDRSDFNSKGSHKTCVIASKDTLSFVLNEALTPDDDVCQLPAFLNKLDCIVIPRVVSATRLIIRNAGTDLIDYKGPVAVKEFERLVSQLDEMHRRGYCHLDIKLDNLCIDAKINAKKVVRLIDCDGISSTIRRIDSIACTPGYMPETCAVDLLNNSNGFEQTRKLKVLMDQYAMLASMILATRTSLGFSQREQAAFMSANETMYNFNYMLATKPDALAKLNLSPDTGLSVQQELDKHFALPIYVRNALSATFIDRWIAKYVKPEYVKTVTFLLTHPKLYLEYLDDQPLPLHEMLNWDEN